jgi:hypothetical protein
MTINDSTDAAATAAGSITVVLRIARSIGACRDWSALNRSGFTLILWAPPSEIALTQREERGMAHG